jgi:phosphatidylglycerol:prolipoprotein diacylglycerol transferase
MRPVLFEIPLPAIYIGGFVLIGLGAAWVLFSGWRWARERSRRAAAVPEGEARDVAPTSQDRFLGIVLGGALIALGFYATRYIGPPLPMYSFGILLGLGIVLGWIVAARLADAARIDRGVSRGALALVLVLVFVGARAAFIATHPSLFEGRGFADFFALREGGFSPWGGLVLSLLGLAVYARLRRSSFWSLADALAAALPIGIAFTQAGNFLFGSDYGRPAGLDFSLAVRFPGSTMDGCGGSPAFRHHCLCLSGQPPEGFDCGGVAGTTADLTSGADGLASLPVHPVQLYEVGVVLALFAFVWISQRKRAFEGQTILVFALFYAVARYLLDMVTHDPIGVRIWLWTPGQLATVITLPILALIFFFRMRSTRTS